MSVTPHTLGFTSLLGVTFPEETEDYRDENQESGNHREEDGEAL